MERATAIAAAAGRRKGRGFYADKVVAQAKREGFRFHKVRMSQRSLRRFLMETRVGSFYVRKVRHAFAIVNGKPTERQPRGVKILEAWQLLSNGEKPVSKLMWEHARQAKKEKRRRSYTLTEWRGLIGSEVMRDLALHGRHFALAAFVLGRQAEIRDMEIMATGCMPVDRRVRANKVEQDPWSEWEMWQSVKHEMNLEMEAA